MAQRALTDLERIFSLPEKLSINLSYLGKWPGKRPFIKKLRSGNLKEVCFELIREILGSALFLESVLRLFERFWLERFFENLEKALNPRFLG